METRSGSEKRWSEWKKSKKPEPGAEFVVLDEISGEGFQGSDIGNVTSDSLH